MNVSLNLLLEVNLTLSLVLGLILCLRRPMARYLGPASAYGLWMTAPAAMAASLLPERTRETLVADFLVQGRPPGITELTQSHPDSLLSLVCVVLWLGGALAMGAYIGHQQRRFALEADRGRAGPAVMGFRYPRIVVPDDFEQRFSYSQRQLILTHEQVHLDRNDLRVNGLVAVVRCLLWFNPLVHIAAIALRRDQELSCDAEVIQRRPRMRRAYAETLLKTQMNGSAPPVACLWRTLGQHPLTDRIGFLGRQPASARRRQFAGLAVMTLIGVTAGSVWAIQPERQVFRETETIIAPFRVINAREALSSADTDLPSVDNPESAVAKTGRPSADPVTSRCQPRSLGAGRKQGQTPQSDDGNTTSDVDAGQRVCAGPAMPRHASEAGSFRRPT